MAISTADVRTITILSNCSPGSPCCEHPTFIALSNGSPIAARVQADDLRSLVNEIALEKFTLMQSHTCLSPKGEITLGRPEKVDTAEAKQFLLTHFKEICENCGINSISTADCALRKILNAAQPKESPHSLKES